MKKARTSEKPASAEAVARLAEQGKDISAFFKPRGRMVQPNRLARRARRSQS